MPTSGPKGLIYPEIRQDDSVKDVLHGQSVADPFRWLESPDSPETEAFVAAQNGMTAEYFGKFKAFREENLAKLRGYQNFERVSNPFKRGDAYYIYKNTGLQNQDVLFKLPLTGNEATAPPDLFHAATTILDLNADFPEGTTSLGTRQFSEDGKYLAYGLQHAGSDWQTIHVLDAVTGAKMGDSIPWAKFTSIAWTHDSKGFFYTRYPAPAEAAAGGAGTETASNENSMVCYHALGSDASTDITVHRDPEHPTWRFGVETSEDGKLLFVSVFRGTDPVNRMYVANISGFDTSLTRDAPLLKVLVGNFDAKYDYITTVNNTLLLLTNLDAAKYRIVTINVDGLDLPSVSSTSGDVPTPTFETLVPEDHDNVLDWSSITAGKYLLLCYIHHATNVIKVAEVNPSASGVAVTPRGTVALPAASTVVGADARFKNRVSFVKVTSPLMPGNSYRLEPSADGTLSCTEWYRISVAGFNSDDFEARQEFVPSADGSVKLPMFVVRSKAASTATPQPTLLYAYGGFNVSLQPTFSATRLLWISHLKATYALAIIRGGGEYGEEWHQAGARLKKQNCFDDMASCAKFLIESGATTPKQLSIMGGSNGGLLVLACALQQPQLYGAVISQVPVTDMLRFHKFTIGSAWRGEYGYVEDSKEDFENVMKYSPLHKAQSFEGQLPSILITTADHDDRVVPLHSFKMIATLQSTATRNGGNAAPLLARIDVKAGHGAGKPTSKVLEEYADIFSFLYHETALKHQSN